MKVYALNVHVLLEWSRRNEKDLSNDQNLRNAAYIVHSIGRAETSHGEGGDYTSNENEARIVSEK